MGYPSGIGALVIRNGFSSNHSTFLLCKDVSNVLQKVYFGGGTIEACSSYDNYHQLRSVVHERFDS